MPDLVPVVSRGLFYLATTGVAGIVAFRWLVLEPARRDPLVAVIAFPALRRLWNVGWVLAALTLSLLPLRFGIQAVELFGADALARGAVLLSTPWGTSWWLHAGAAVLLPAGLAMAGAEGRRIGWGTAVLAGLLLAVVPGLSGHAAAAEPRALVLANDALHVAAAGAWAGALFALIVVGAPAIREADVPVRLGGPLAALARLVGAFSRAAVPAVALLLLTGAVNAWAIVGSWEGLFESRYGRTLLAKVALALPTLLLGLYHWRVSLPALRTGTGETRFRTTARAELGLALVVLAVTALLALTPH